MAFLLALGGPLACGQGPGRGPGLAAEGADSQAQGLLRGDDDADEDDDEDEGDEPDACEEMREQLQEDAFKMQRTKEFRAVAKTEAFKKVQSDIKKMQAKGCSLSGISADMECNKLKMQAYKHQQALMQTKEFQSLAKTREWKKFMKSAQEAMDNDCLEGLDMGYAAETRPLMLID